MNNHIPNWLLKIASESDLAIIDHPKAVFLKEDPDGNRLPEHQQWIESPAGSIWIDSLKEEIVGYGPAVKLPSKSRRP